MVGSTPTIIDSYLKDQFEPGEVIKYMVENHFFLDDIGTSERGTGRQLIVPFLDSNAQGLGATRALAQFGAAQTLGGNIGGGDWNIPWGSYMASVYIGDKAMAVSASDIGAFLQDKKEEVKSLYAAWGDYFETLLLRDSGRSLGSGTISTGVITLTNKQDILNFERGMILTASAAAGLSSSDTLIDASLGYVVLVNYNTGLLTVSATSGGAAGTPTNWTGTMYFFRSGDFGGDSAPATIVDSFGAWCPALSPTETSFRGVDRRVDPLRRSGVRLLAADVTGLGLEDRIKKLLVKMSSRGKPAKRVLLHDEQWLSLANSLESRGNRPIDGKVGIFSFPKLQVASPRGMVDVFASPRMPVDACYAYDPKAIKFKSVDGFPAVMNGDGMQMLRKSDEDTYEFRLKSYPAYYHKDPPATGRCPLLVP